MKTRLNVKLLVIVAVSAVALGGALYQLHAFQARRAATALLQLAKEAEKKGEHPKTLKYLHLYLKHVPSDTDALAAYGTTLAKVAGAPAVRTEAFFTLEKVIRRDPGRADVRRVLVELAMHPDLDRSADAEDHLRALLRAAPGDAKLEYQLAQSLEANRKYADAE